MENIDWDLDDEGIVDFAEQKVLEILAYEAAEQAKNELKLLELNTGKVKNFEEVLKKSLDQDKDSCFCAPQIIATLLYQKQFTKRLSEAKSDAERSAIIKIVSKILADKKLKRNEALKFMKKKLSLFEAAREKARSRQQELDFLSFLDYVANLPAEDDIADDEEVIGEVVERHERVEPKEVTQKKFDMNYVDLPDQPCLDQVCYDPSCVACNEEVKLGFTNLCSLCPVDDADDEVVQIPGEAGVHLLSKCGHPIHLTCLEMLAEGRKGEKSYFCPACRTSIPYHEANPNSWRKKYHFSWEDLP